MGQGKEKVDIGRSLYLVRQKKDCRKHLAKSGSLPPPDHNLRGYDMERACQGCTHCNMQLAPYCHVARVEHQIRPVRRPITGSGSR